MARGIPEHVFGIEKDPEMAHNYDPPPTDEPLREYKHSSDTTFDKPYCFNSILQYSGDGEEFNFNKKTLESKGQLKAYEDAVAKNLIGQRAGLADCDKNRLRWLYCDHKNNEESLKKNPMLAAVRPELKPGDTNFKKRLACRNNGNPKRLDEVVKVKPNGHGIGIKGICEQPSKEISSIKITGCVNAAGEEADDGQKITIDGKLGFCIRQMDKDNQPTVGHYEIQAAKLPPCKFISVADGKTRVDLEYGTEVPDGNVVIRGIADLKSNNPRTLPATWQCVGGPKKPTEKNNHKDVGAVWTEKMDDEGLKLVKQCVLKVGLDYEAMTQPEKKAIEHDLGHAVRCRYNDEDFGPGCYRKFAIPEKKQKNNNKFKYIFCPAGRHSTNGVEVVDRKKIETLYDETAAAQLGPACSNLARSIFGTAKALLSGITGYGLKGINGLASVTPAAAAQFTAAKDKAKGALDGVVNFASGAWYHGWTKKSK